MIPNPIICVVCDKVCAENEPTGIGPEGMGYAHVACMQTRDDRRALAECEERAWVAFAMNALPASIVMPPDEADGEEIEKVTGVAAKFADAMLVRWRNRFGKDAPR